MPELIPRPPDNAFWATPAQIATQLAAKGMNVLCYELGPTGPLHAGILRVLQFAEQIRRSALSMGKGVEFVVRINDLAPAKRDNGAVIEELGQGFPIAAAGIGDGGATMLQLLRADLNVIYERTGWPPPRVVMVSDIYASPVFAADLQRSLVCASQVFETLSQHKASSVSLMYPICPMCGRVRSSELNSRMSNHERWKCRHCGTVFFFHASTSPKAVTFKLEQALIWQSLAADVDLHGQDHIEAYKASAEIVVKLHLQHLPRPARVNLVFGPDPHKLSKSRRNFTPLSSISNDVFKELLLRIERTPAWRPLRLEG